VFLHPEAFLPKHDYLNSTVSVPPSTVRRAATFSFLPALLRCYLSVVHANADRDDHSGEKSQQDALCRKHWVAS
jgi:hypothetical protein